MPTPEKPPESKRRPLRNALTRTLGWIRAHLPGNGSSDGGKLEEHTAVEAHNTRARRDLYFGFFLMAMGTLGIGLLLYWGGRSKSEVPDIVIAIPSALFGFGFNQSWDA